MVIETSHCPSRWWNKRQNWQYKLVALQISIEFSLRTWTISHSIVRPVGSFSKRIVSISDHCILKYTLIRMNLIQNFHHKIISFNWLFVLLASMRFARFPMHSNRIVLSKTKVAKQTNSIMLAEVIQMPCICSIKPLATWKMCSDCETMTHPNNRKPMNTLPLNGILWVDCCDEQIPKLAKCPWTISKIFILNWKNFWSWQLCQ